MSPYKPPVEDMIFLLYDVLGFSHDDLDRETGKAVLEEAAKLASDVLAPLNYEGDRNGASLKDGKVKTAPGFRAAYRQYREGGWNAVPFPEEFGGQGLPWALAFPIQEMWQGANMSFGLCPLLNQGAVEAILAHGNDEQKERYLPKLISGEWTGTMNLTEPQAGSDLGLLTCKAEPQKNGTYKISGQKIYITYGEHDFTENIIHLVLARTPGAPEDVKGISLFIVPKILEDERRNAVRCIGLEEKLGIHASPTCTMEFDGATGYLLGAENEGLKAMFTMMNNARLSVGLQGVAIAEAACQKARLYAAERIQGKDLKTGQRVSIDNHPDIRRMLLAMQSLTEAGRALTYEAAMALDRKNTAADLLTPVVKAWCTDMACEVASLGIQVHGGMGYIEETGAAQYYRDARILPIYEGTNGIQAADFVFRKILRDKGEAAQSYMESLHGRLPERYQKTMAPVLSKLQHAVRDIQKCAGAGEMDKVSAAATPFLKAFGIVAGGALLARAADKAEAHSDGVFKSHKELMAAFYLHNILPEAESALKSAMEGSAYI